MVAESLRQAGLGTTLSSSRSPFETLHSDNIEARWKKNIQRRLVNREYFWPPQWAKTRIQKLIMNSGRCVTKPSSVAIAGDVTVQVGGGDDSVAVGQSVMDFLDGYEYIEEVMIELNFPSAEISSRKAFVKWLFWSMHRLTDQAKMFCAEQFLLRYHGHRDWMVAASSESVIWMEGVSLSNGSAKEKAAILGGNSRSQSGPSSAQKKRKRSGESRSSSDKKDRSSNESKSRDRDRDPPKARISGTCDSRVDKRLSCRSERNGGDGKSCKYSHTCPRCPGEDHPASKCGKM